MRVGAGGWAGEEGTARPHWATLAKERSGRDESGTGGFVTGRVGAGKAKGRSRASLDAIARCLSDGGAPNALLSALPKPRRSCAATSLKSQPTRIEVTGPYSTTHRASFDWAGYARIEFLAREAIQSSVDHHRHVARKI